MEDEVKEIVENAVNALTMENSRLRREIATKAAKKECEKLEGQIMKTRHQTRVLFVTMDTLENKIYGITDDAKIPKRSLPQKGGGAKGDR
ncbi:unnamed protein product [Heligmosomoides polygyrus]|uniref:WRKY domain-containing protein n=1 Tax=Heligmosomoides polygyrus TaxID=6339 RepID=A0A183FIK2_HELPZ|nr:unnamed protein product [Heligmosomoides polygyrus]